MHTKTNSLPWRACRGSHASSTLFSHNADDNPELALHQVLDFDAADIGLDGVAVGRLKTANGHHLVRYDSTSIEFLAQIKVTDAGGVRLGLVSTA